jgi:hypothetical protein
MSLALEPEQQRATVLVGFGKQHGEAGVDRVEDVLGPSRPLRESRSESRVKPERSMNTTVPSRVRTRS